MRAGSARPGWSQRLQGGRGGGMVPPPPRDLKEIPHTKRCGQNFQSFVKMTVISFASSIKTKCTEYMGPHKANKKPGGLSKGCPVDKYVKYIYKKKKLNVHLWPVTGQLPLTRGRGPAQAQTQGSAAPGDGGVSFLRKISLVFLSQGLRSDEIAKMRALLGLFSINIRKVPLRL